MPRYDYECPYHGVFEVEQNIKEDALEACPKPVKVIAGVDEGQIKECCAPVKRLLSAVVGKVIGGTPRHYR